MNDRIDKTGVYDGNEMGRTMERNGIDEMNDE